MSISHFMRKTCYFAEISKPIEIDDDDDDD